MNAKYVVSEINRPNYIIELMLQGAKVPKGFKCDGCSSSPDFHWVWACNIHDYEASISRDNWQ